MNNKKSALPNMDFTFKIQMEGAETGVNWVGDFVYRRPSLGARSRIAALRNQLNGSVEVMDDPEVEDFNHAISHLRHTLTDFPQWWFDAAYGMELHDGNVVSEVYNKCMDFEKRWRLKVHGGSHKDVEVGNDNPIESAGNESTIKEPAVNPTNAVPQSSGDAGRQAAQQ